MDEVQAAIDPGLKKLAFKKFGRTYNRETDPGIVQVINFQMGAYEPPQMGISPVPKWLKPDLYGWFAVNLGVFVKEIDATKHAWPQGKFIRESSCAIRMRLGRLMAPAGKEFWWKLDQPADAIVKDIEGPLHSTGMAFLNRFKLRDIIISDWVRFNDAELHLTNVARLDVGIMLAAQGEKTQAAALFAEHLNLPSRNPGHARYVRELAAKLELALV